MKQLIKTHSPKYIAAVLLIAVSLAYQNCGNKHMSVIDSSSLSSSDTGSLIITEPEDDDETDDPLLRKVQVNQIVASRILTANFFVAIFGTKITNYVTTNIAEQPKDFGSGNTIYDRVITPTCGTTKNIYSPCATNIPLSLPTPDTLGVNVRREAFRIRSCHYGVNNLAIDALKKISSTATTANPPSITNANLSKAFQLFYRGRRPANTEVLESLMIVSQKKSKPIEKWKDVLLTICLSPHWQVL